MLPIVCKTSTIPFTTVMITAAIGIRIGANASDSPLNMLRINSATGVNMSTSACKIGPTNPFRTAIVISNTTPNN